MKKRAVARFQYLLSINKATDDLKLAQFDLSSGHVAVQVSRVLLR